VSWLRRTKTEESLSLPAIRSARGYASVADLVPRARVAVVGEVDHVCTVDYDGVTSFEISVADETGSIVALWTGRPKIACIERGRRLALYGRAAPQRREDALVVYNPRYELLPLANE
jgi:hypothetical protein